MSEMVERVAQAIQARVSAVDAPWERLDERCKNVWRRDARTAITAMREPTEAMLSAAGSPAVFTTIGNPNLSWSAMIDAALEEKSA